MMNNKRGMSAVVTTLIIILLVIVALGIIWVVVKNVINSGKEQVELADKCRAIELTAITIDDTAGDGSMYDITISRTGAGEEIAGIKIVLANTVDNTYSDVLEFGIALVALETKTATGLNLTDSEVVSANKIEMTPYFLSDLGEVQICSTPIETEF